jgi:hypothetical protein
MSFGTKVRKEKPYLHYREIQMATILDATLEMVRRKPATAIEMDAVELKSSRPVLKCAPKGLGFGA